jgi:hypothetical protein
MKVLNQKLEDTESGLKECLFPARSAQNTQKHLTLASHCKERRGMIFMGKE